MSKPIKEKSIRQHAISGMIWGSVGQFGNQVFNFILSIILARLLAPEEFGLLALITFFLSISDVFINSGLGTALIRTKGLKSIDFSTVFYYNISISLFFYALVFLCAPYIAAFYNNPLLVNITRWIALTLIFNSFSLVQNAIASKELNFKRIKLIELIALAVSIPISIFLAYKGFGVYSLVGLNISQSATKAILYWSTSKWKPTFEFSILSFKKLFSFGSKILITNIYSTFIGNIESVLIGKMFSPASLGFYFRAFSTKELPLKIFSSAIALPVYSLLAKYNDDNHEFKRIHLKFYKIISFIFFPMSFGMIALAKPLVIVLYTAKWLPSVPMIQIMSITIICFLIGYLQDQTIIAAGGANRYLKLSLINKTLRILTIPFGLFFGLFPFIISLTIVSIINLIYSNHVGGKYVNMNNYKYLLLSKKHILTSVLMGFTLYLCNLIIIDNQFLKLSVLTLIGLLIYLGISLAFKFEELHYIINLMRPHIFKYLKIKT
jgi:O-antigen/teichoic acid export membrane protein